MEIWPIVGRVLLLALSCIVIMPFRQKILYGYMKYEKEKELEKEKKNKDE